MLLMNLHSLVSKYNSGYWQIVAKFADVQLTKDHIPVIYHDFLVSETGIDSPMHTITHEQVRFNFRCLDINQPNDYSSCISAMSNLISVYLLCSAKQVQNILRPH